MLLLILNSFLFFIYILYFVFQLFSCNFLMSIFLMCCAVPPFFIYCLNSPPIPSIGGKGACVVG